MTRVEFVSYSGKYPYLCSGVLKLKIDGEEITFPAGSLISGGGIERYPNEKLIEGDWKVILPKELEHLNPLLKEITECVNLNIEHGCCGGCI